MKTFANKNTKSENVTQNKQASTQSIIQSYKKNSPTHSATQLASYSKSVTLSDDISSADINDWGIVRTKLGGIAKGKDANSKIAGRANSSLVALGLNTSNDAMSGHMIPNRIGGAGNTTNVRPWDSSFEAGTWEVDVEQKFNSQIVGSKGKTVSYSVDTTDMSDSEATTIINKSTDATEKLKPEHKTNIQQIPMKVKATVGNASLAETNEPIVNLIK